MINENDNEKRNNNMIVTMINFIFIYLAIAKQLTKNFNLCKIAKECNLSRRNIVQTLARCFTFAR